MKTAILVAVAALAVVALVGAGAVRSSGVLAKVVPQTAASPPAGQGELAGADTGLDHQFNSTHDGDFANETGEW